MPELDQYSDTNSDARLANALKGDTITDEEGLSRAYDSDTNVFANGNTLYVAGSKNPFTTMQGVRDWYDDFTKIPFNNVEQSDRYQQVMKAISANPNLTQVVGHSLAGSVSLQLQKNMPSRIKFTRVYGAPVLDLIPKSTPVDRYRNLGDPVSILDRNANNSLKLNPLDSGSLTHDYKNIAKNFKSEGTDNVNGWKNQDGSISLIQ